MRRRSTFVHDPSLDVNPQQLYVSGDRFVIDKLRAAREERLTFGFNELPEELWQVLRQSHELHIRWASERIYNATSPFVSKTSPGLHVFYTPSQEQSGDLFCPLLYKVFANSLKCRSPLSTFISQRPPMLQYHSLLPSLNTLTRYIQRNLCKHSDQHCIHNASLLNIADTLDIDYDSISNTLTFTVHWSSPPVALLDPISGQITENAWSVTVESPPGAEKVEVGILSNETPTDPSEFNLSGFLTVVGEDDHPKPTLFSFPSRHHALPPSQAKQQQYTISFRQPTGLHPTMQIFFPNSSALVSPASKSPSSTCALHAYLTLPSPIFADKYQLSTSDPVFLASHNLVSLRSISGETDLEAPNYLVGKWGSNLLLELATIPTSLSTTTRFNSYFTPKSNDHIDWNITIPLHLRYLPPSPSGQTTISVPQPIIFWACTEQCGSKFPVNPFDRVNLGYEALFGVRTMFWHLDPNPNSISRGELGSGSGSVIDGTGDAGRLVQHINMPVLNTSVWGAEWVEIGTVLAVSLGFAWVCWKLVPSLRFLMGSEGGETVGGAGVGVGEKVEGQGVQAKAKDEGKKTQ